MKIEKEEIDKITRAFGLSSLIFSLRDLLMESRQC